MGLLARQVRCNYQECRIPPGALAHDDGMFPAALRADQESD